MQCHCIQGYNVLIYKINGNTVLLFLLAIDYHSLKLTIPN